MAEHATHGGGGAEGATHGQEAGHGHGHNPHVHHHFDTEQQQFDSDKLGMWLFLTTEILMFSGLFCAYAVYRANHPEVFIFAHQFLDVKWGFLNTIILLFSSFTMAWAVRAAQLGQKKLLIPLLAITILCGFGFMGVKTIEYTSKFHHGTIWGKSYAPTREAYAEHIDPAVLQKLEAAGQLKFAPSHSGHDEDDAAGHDAAAPHDAHAAPATDPHAAAPDLHAGAPADPADPHAPDAPPVAPPAAPAAADPNAPVIVELGQGVIASSAPPVLPPTVAPTTIARDAQGNLIVDHSKVPPAAIGQPGLAYTPTAERIGTRWSSKVEAPQHGHKQWEADIPANPQVFFSIYFTMTGLHGLHVLFGMIAIFIVMVISAKGGYGADYMTPVDLVGLFWHLVDLVWIFLFPLLYLIH